jgi:hypothetical protein
VKKDRHSNEIIQKYKDNVLEFDIKTLKQGKINRFLKIQCHILLKF